MRNEGVRLDYLDGLRGVAVLAVIFFHWLSSSSIEMYYRFPLAMGEFWFFEYGYYGVHLFFVISGFVIAMTLSGCNSARSFVIRRLARLWPAMLLCSISTFFYLRFFGETFAVSAWNFVPSLTFSDPYIFNKMIGAEKFNWMDGAYWSLFVEVRFYAWMAFIYFFTRSFSRNFLFLCAAAYISRLFMSDSKWIFLLNMVFFTDYMLWFVLGMSFYFLNANRKKEALCYFFAAAAFLAAKMVDSFLLAEIYAFMAIAMLFSLLRLSGHVRGLFSQRWLAGVGVASYSLYLLHQNIGVDLNFKLAEIFGADGFGTAMALLSTLFVLLVITRVIYQCYEYPLNRWLVKSFVSR